VDADDALMFFAIDTGRIDTEGLSFLHQRADTASLNRLAQSGQADVCAVSLGAVPRGCRPVSIVAAWGLCGARFWACGGLSKTDDR